MSSFLKSLFVLVSVITILVLYVVVEVIVAMFAYMYLALNHVEIFGTFISFSRDVLNLFANQLEKYSPELANRAYTTLLGELGPKSILLLLIGLIVGALGRLISWIVRRWIHSARLGLPGSIR